MRRRGNLVAPVSAARRLARPRNWLTAGENGVQGVFHHAAGQAVEPELVTPLIEDILPRCSAIPTPSTG
jgi:hypothetical protein